MFNFFKPKPAIPAKPKSLGQLGEEFAQREYEKLGYKIIAKNEFNKKGLRRGEIDFIAQGKDHLAFVEVKTRKPGFNKFGSGQEAVNWSKQAKLLSAAKLFLLRNPKLAGLRPQIDVYVAEYSEVDKSFKCAKILMNVVEDSF